MKAEFLTIKEAADRFGRAEITVRRLVRQVVQKKNTPNRRFIRPGIMDAERFQKKKKPYAYSISTDLLKKAYGAALEKVAEVLTDKQSDTEIFEGSLAHVLRKANEQLEKQLSVKDEQIKALNQTLEDLSERQRETNILMKGLQERLLIESPRRRWWRFWRKERTRFDGQ
ncbi:hypothetical protein HYZ98_04120 [Candidatus Peregrinibacteria bacterium]|nr:hypothetical protein [Candidatus Peregrinibacteria bacterium]